MTLCAEAAINIPISFWLFLWSFLDQNERVGTTVRKKNLWDWARSWNTKFIYIKKNDILLREAIKNGFIWYPLKKRFGTRKVIFLEMFNQKGVKYAIKKMVHLVQLYQIKPFLLAPSGALVFIMVYYIPSNPLFQIFQILQILKCLKDPTSYSQNRLVRWWGNFDRYVWVTGGLRVSRRSRGP